jgi:hypothetical protein
MKRVLIVSVMVLLVIDLLLVASPFIRGGIQDYRFDHGGFTYDRVAEVEAAQSFGWHSRLMNHIADQENGKGNW